ncbi:MAG: hypothetical protein U0804_06405 [Gemmataceae bacterium]
MFKIGETPNPTAHPNDHADFIELECLRQTDGNASGGDLTAAIKRLEDDDPERRATSDVRHESIVDAAFTELRNRATYSGSGYYRYPFRVSEDDQLLELKGPPDRRELYLFMLLATRMNMQADRVQAGINGTELFERICCEVAKNYWGDASEGIVFGTARRTPASEVGNFPAAVNDLCTRLREGVRFHSHSQSPPEAQDGNLDVVVWKDFADQRVGKLIGFGQCKTGTHWARSVFDLQPEGFCAKWILTQPVVKPVRLYFITSTVRHHQWYDACVDSGVMFDRCRILNYAPRMHDLRAEWVAWTAAALASKGMVLP